MSTQHSPNPGTRSARFDWSADELAGDPLIRAVFVASRVALANPMLTESIPVRHIRH